MRNVREKEWAERRNVFTGRADEPSHSRRMGRIEKERKEGRCDNGVGSCVETMKLLVQNYFPAKPTPDRIVNLPRSHRAIYFNRKFNLCSFFLPPSLCPAPNNSELFSHSHTGVSELQQLLHSTYLRTQAGEGGQWVATLKVLFTN